MTSAAIPVLHAWAASLPEKWQSDWLKWNVALSTARPREQDVERLPYISNEDIESWTGKLLNQDPKPVEADSRLFKKNDVLFNKLRPYLAKVYHAKFDGLSSGELLCLRPSAKVYPRYLFYLVSSKGFVDAVNAETFGSKMPRADWGIVGHAPLPLPPKEIQERIAGFLDAKTTQIDALISKKQALLECLAEKRQAIITQAVTKGLDPTAPMKDSGIDWLGQIPAHWEVKRLKFFTDGLLKYGANAPADWDDPNWPRFIRITDVDASGKLNDETFRSLPPDIADPYLLAEGDILLARSGATVGKSFIFQPEWGKCCYAGYLIKASISSSHDAHFIYLFLNSSSFWSWVAANFIQSTIQNINADKYANLRVPCPPKEEQRSIASYVAQAIARLEKQEKAVTQSVATLHEYRSALITAAVTGQIQGLQ
jgi:type I restriction enzyme S subunit